MGRIRGSRLLAWVAAGAALLTALTAQPATAAESPTMTKLSLGADRFKLTDTSFVSATNKLYNDHLTKHVDLTDVVTTNFTTNSSGAADSWMNLRSMRSCTGTETKALPPVGTKNAWCWSSAHTDDTTPHWWPQGMSTTGTADGGDGAIQDRRVAAVAWHYRTLSGETSAGCKTNNLLKLTFLDRDTLKYRHVLLVEPTGSGSGFKYVTGHGGGIVWYANYIYVTDTAHGIRVFDINKMAKVDTYGSGVSTYGISGGRSSACGYPYVLPEVHYYKQAGTPSDCSGNSIDPDRLCFSWLSLDKTGGGPYKLVAGEWHGYVDGGRVVRYQLNPTSASSYPGLLNMSGGRTVIQDAYAASRYRGLQGGMTWTDAQGVLHFGFHKGCGTKPGVYSHTWVGDTRAGTSCAAGGNWAAGPPQALSHWPRLGTQTVDELWGLTEGICAGSTLRSQHSEFKAVPESETTDACRHHTGAGNLSLRTVFTVGFSDPAVQNLH
ncbi:hypothetical protein MTQ10_03410 [Streptomyces sp. XM83C]|jgi:hypothetical protein|uniref:Secreted protein n=1 Tax=Streptomyces thermocoprophilus TaxID=78356 RepID=A0ABV5VFP2_9ACTN|nr:hypothetical protein [Streptomyces sp. XM83C]MCK1818675.1 hypothetical protein [Streptomyces sp. XM83C]